ncbi:MAG TPA: glycosyltransferase family 39 protein [Candidatus Kapabacteria bacterium]|nr:glycosyltransferase family 39 protein [Candidatus Kapabacteria bacterium]
MKEKRWLLWIVLAGLAFRVAAWFYFRAHTLALVTDRLPDDALYYFTIARNLASGYGMSFDGIHPTNGMHPLWLLLITPIFALHLTQWGFVHATLLLQSFLDVIIVWLIGGTVYDLLSGAKESNRKTAAGAAALIYALSCLVVIRSMNGLETTVAALLFVLWLRVYIRAAKGLRWTGWTILGIVTGLLLLARTDSFIALIPITLYLITTHWKVEWRRMLWALFIVCVVISPWLIWNMIHFGTIMQSSGEAMPMLAWRKYYATYGPFILNYWHLLPDALRNVLKPFWYAAFGLPLLTICYAIIARKKTLLPGERAIYLLVFGGILLLIVHSLFRGFIRDWYVEELIPLFLIGFGVSIGANAGHSETRTSGRWTLAAVIIVLQLFFYRKPQYVSQAAVLQLGVPVVENLSAQSKVASFNSGYYAYFESQQGNVVDIDGVVNSDALAALKSGHLGAYLDRDSVSYILDFEGDFGGYLNLFDRHLLDHFALESILANPNDSGNPLVLYRRLSIPGHKEVPSRK